MQSHGNTTGGDTQLRDVAALEARDEADVEAAAWLREPDMLDAWRDALVELLTDVQAQHAERRAEVHAARRLGREAYETAVAEHAKWSAKATRFRQSLEARLRECRRLQRERDEGKATDVRRTILTRLDDAEFRLARLERSVQAVATEVSR